MLRSTLCATKMPCVQPSNSFCYREMSRQLNSWLLCIKFLVSFIWKTISSLFLYISLDVIALWILHSLRLIHRNVLVSKQIIYKSNLLHFQWVLFWKLSVLFMGVVTCCSIQSIVIMPWSCSNFSYADISVPRYVRVNTLKLDVDSALLELQKKYSVF